MREIKFRAWNYDDEEMVKDSRIVIQGGTVFGSPKDYANEISEDLELMQYTGLKDKNGVEIYEGDIMVLNKLKPSYYVVRYEDNQFILDGISLFDNVVYFAEREVIGNIYENPELLEAKDK